MKTTKLSLMMCGLLISTLAKADPGVFLGLTYAFGGGGPGITLNVLSSNKQNEGVVGAGVGFYPLSSNKFGAGVNAGYNFDNAGVNIGYDFLQQGVQVGVGYVNTKNKDNPPAPAPAVVTPPAPPPPPSARPR